LRSLALCYTLARPLALYLSLSQSSRQHSYQYKPKQKGRRVHSVFMLDANHAPVNMICAMDASLSACIIALLLSCSLNPSISLAPILIVAVPLSLALWSAISLVPFFALCLAFSPCPPLSLARSLSFSLARCISRALLLALFRARVLSHTLALTHTPIFSLLLTLSRCISALPDATHLQLV